MVSSYVYFCTWYYLSLSKLLGNFLALRASQCGILSHGLGEGRIIYLMNLSWSLKSQTHCLLVIVKSQKTLERSNSGKDLYFLNANIGVRWRPKFQKVSPGQINQNHLPGCWISLRRKYPGATLIICVNMPLFVNAIENVSHTIMEGVKLDPGCIVPAAEGRGQVWVVFLLQVPTWILIEFLVHRRRFYSISTDTPVAMS